MKILLLSRQLFIFIVLSIGFLYTGCNTSSDPISDEFVRGKIIETEYLTEYSVEELQALFSLFSNQVDFTPLYSVTVHKVIYQTIDPWGNFTEASGAIFIPVSSQALPFVSLQHGTQSRRDAVASVDPLNGFEGIIAATLGYYACHPDYLGLGISSILHPYHHAASSASTVIDILRASHEFADNNNIILNGQTFLTGYSEGGFVTLAAFKEIEANHPSEFNLTAVSAMAGAYDLRVSATEIIQQEIYNMPGFISFLITAYDNVYEWNRIDYFFSETYAAKIPGLFDGSKTIYQINPELTNSITDLFSEDFIAAVKDGTETEVLNALSENSLIDWRPATPLLLVHGNADEYVPYENSVSAYNSFLSRGATDVELLTIEGGTHSTAVIPAISATMEWFASFTQNTQFVINK